MTGKRLLLFDIDGTLIHSGGAGVHALILALKERHGIDDDLHDIEIAGMTDAGIVISILKKHKIPVTNENISAFLDSYVHFLSGELPRRKGNLLPGVAPVAMQEGRYVAKTIGRDLKKSPRQNFHYVDKGSLATIGRAAAVAQFGKLHISGYVAWLGWLFIHIFFLIGFRNRLIVLIQWAWSYLTYERGARLITGDTTLPGWTVAPKEKLSEPEPLVRR